MTQSDAYYRALLAYRAQLDQKRECVRDCRAVSSAEGNETVKVTRVRCTVDEEWIKAIEEGLEFVEKAIQEERQFIYSNGEIIPIEKVKHVSKDSVQHLARHSDLITRVPEEGHDLIPDKLYTVEKINDYTVYENRFLYMLLCYLRDFVTIRYQKILDITSRYEGEIAVQKQVTILGRTLDLNVDVHDLRKDDVYMIEHNPAKPLIDRIDLILKTVLSFLATPLMESAGKAPMLKPPITKTNVLKMDNNFKGAVKLYEYIIAYEGPGFETEDEIKELSPFRDDLAEDMAQAQLMIAFAAYKHGLGLTEALKAAHELDIEKQRQKDFKKKSEQLASIRRRLANEGKDPEEYILVLEQHVRALQKEADKINAMAEEIEVLKVSEASLTQEVISLTKQVSTLENTIETLKQDHESEIAALNASFLAQKQEMEAAHAAQLSELAEKHTAEIVELNEKHTNELSAVNQAHAAQLDEIKTRHTSEISSLNERYTAEISTLNQRHSDELSALEERRVTEVEALTGELSDCRAEIERRTSENQSLTDKNRLLGARVVALRSDKGDFTDEEIQQMAEQEGFDELERQLETFVKFYEKEWALAKRKMRKGLLNLKYIKGQSDEE